MCVKSIYTRNISVACSNNLMIQSVKTWLQRLVTSVASQYDNNVRTSVLYAKVYFYAKR